VYIYILVISSSDNLEKHLEPGEALGRISYFIITTKSDK